MNWQRLIFGLMFGEGAVAGWVFVRVYVHNFSWRLQHVGKNLLAFSASLALLMSWVSLRLIWTGMPDWLYSNGLLTIIALLVGTVNWRAVMIMQEVRTLKRKSAQQQSGEHTDAHDV